MEMKREAADGELAAAPPIFAGGSVPDRLPGEPECARPSAAVMAWRLAVRGAITLLLVAVTVWFWPIYWVMAAIYGWPPSVPRSRQVVRYLRHTWTLRPSPPGLTVGDRAWITLSIIRMCATTPVWGTAWLLDEVLYGPALDAAKVEAPLIEISAARSGSTQLARYLEEDPGLVATPFLQCLFPYLWAWRLVPQTLGRFMKPDAVRRQMESRLPPEFWQRHEGDPFLTDTFDVLFMGNHLNPLSLGLGPEVMAQDFVFGPPTAHNQEFWQIDFVNFLDRIARKTLVNASPGPDGKSRRFFVKGHFLCAADALERRYPDACFLTMIREPAPRLQSIVNFLRAVPLMRAIGRNPPWPWLGEAIATSETAYCEFEQDWFSRQTGARRCVLRFSEYVRDLEGTMAKVYRECLDTPELPSYVPRSHAPRERTDYILDRTLKEVGIDEHALNDRLAGYIDWCHHAE